MEVATQLISGRQAITHAMLLKPTCSSEQLVGDGSEKTGDGRGEREREEREEMNVDAVFDNTHKKCHLRWRLADVNEAGET